MARLGGKSIKLDWKPTGNIDRLEVWEESLTDAPHAIDFRVEKFRVRKGSPSFEDLDIAKHELRNPDKATIAIACERAEAFIADAQALDARLMKATRWQRSIEGETACPALLLAGEENPFFARKRERTAEASSGEPVIVTVSTDAREISPDSLAAFIATVKLVQQFRPVHVVWQGAWLTPNACAGYVFHVPLITGDMDFERLAFVVNSTRRDRVSFAFMTRRAMKVTLKSWNNAQGAAEMSYLPGSVDFVNHAGIAGDAESIARRACRWLGWESLWAEQWKAQQLAGAALQSWSEGEESMRPAPPASSYNPPSEAERRRWQRESDEREARANREAARAARERLAEA